MLVFVGTVVLLVGLQVTTVRACEGYEVSLKKLETCDATSLFTIKDPSVVLTEDCKIVFGGCGSYKAFKTAQLTYDIKIDPTNTPFKSMLKDLDLKGDANICEEMKTIPKPYVAILKSFNIAAGCPVVDNKVCASEATSIDLKKYPGYKQVMPIAAAVGYTTGDIKIKHDTGNSCLRFELVVQKKEPVTLLGKTFKNFNPFGKKKKST